MTVESVLAAKCRSKFRSSSQVPFRLVVVVVVMAGNSVSSVSISQYFHLHVHGFTHVSLFLACCLTGSDGGGGSTCPFLCDAEIIAIKLLSFSGCDYDDFIGSSDYGFGRGSDPGDGGGGLFGFCEYFD